MECSGLFPVTEHPVVQLPFPPIPSDMLEGEDQTFYVKSWVLFTTSTGKQEIQQEHNLVCTGDIPSNPTRNHRNGVTEIFAQDLHPDGATTRVPFSTFPGWAQSKPCCRVFLINGITSAAFTPAASCTEVEHTQELTWAEATNDRSTLPFLSV